MRSRWRAFVAIAVTLIWASLYIRSLIDPRFDPSSNVSTVMLVVVTWLFATDIRRRNGNGNGKGNGRA